MYKILSVSQSDIAGGAARAAYRIHHSLRRQNADSTMWVDASLSGDWTVRGPASRWAKIAPRMRGSFGAWAGLLHRTDNHVLHSPAILSTSWPSRLNASRADVLHMHWVNGEMMSIADIGRIRKPVVWTLHDMWAFCGAEHYAEDLRWREGYSSDNRRTQENGFDINRWSWQRKRKHWLRPFHIVSPSNWLADCARSSALMQGWPVTVVPNALDVGNWRPIGKPYARQLMHLPIDVPLLLFSAMGGGRDPRKGFDLLKVALQQLRTEIPELHLVVLGEPEPKEKPDLGFPIHFMGHLHDDVSLRVIYSAADAVVIPSRQDNLPNVGIESQACATPVVAFDACGMPDIVEHGKTGYLAKAFDTVDLAMGLKWVLEDEARHIDLCAAARLRAERLWSYEVVAPQYMAVYADAIKRQN